MRDIAETVFQGLGEASMCWSERPKGVFDSTNAKRIGNEIMQAISEEKNSIYTERNLCVALIAQYAKSVGHKVGIKEHQGEDWEDEWRNVLFIDLPTGQVSWHLHKDELVNFPGIGPYTGEWDGHDTEGKYRRVKAFIHLMNATSKLFFTK